MANLYYDPGQGRAANVRDLFGRIAPHYDLINNLQSLGLHHRWKSRLAKLAVPDAAPPSTRRVLDLCCGTGDIAFRVSRRGAVAIGIDFSEAMLRFARQRATLVPAPTFIRGDALALPFPNQSFDAVTIGYGLRNLASFERGIAEMIRVVKPGGQLLILDFACPENLLWRAIYTGYLRFVVPAIGKLIAGDAAAYGYILESLRHYPSIEGIKGILRSQGCGEINIQRILGGAMSIHAARTPAPSAGTPQDLGAPHRTR
ncbi:MAG: bifunctional demethylmenaquinone methyltransferase/2-methoxy-6-polyprenyl-1,4-benzoquinol methylase UbiE [Verrucomicrobia bacterium]|nr:bifunctional demethylmenaquinone methyltransferase/2-methoxy-6-polyprenyl-1,4-benzoquinol methylase UbiE [Verrucomicrobiota bacterium]